MSRNGASITVWRDESVSLFVARPERCDNSHVRVLALILSVWAIDPWAVSAQERGDVLLSGWRAAIAAHQPGKWDDAAKIVGHWSSADLRAVLGALQRDPPSEALLLSGAMLHSDIAILAPTRRITSAPGDRYVSLSVDGRDVAMQPTEPGWAFARALVEGVRSVAGKAVVKLWCRATAAHMAQTALLADIRPHLEQARRLFPNDPDLMYETGCMHEGYAGPRTQAAIEDMMAPRNLRRPDGTSAGDNLEKAEEWFTRVLAVAPGYHEARVRRGRVRSLRGRQKEAIADLRVAAEGVTEPYVKYHALLFLGGAHEASESIDQARAAYERAAAIYIYAQSPRLALSRLATRRGDMPAAQRHMNQVLRLSPDATNRGDPFWSYLNGNGRRSDALLSALRDAVAEMVRGS